VDLVAALRRGDPDLFADLVDAWSPAMLRIAKVHVAHHHAAEDVVQEAWITALEGMDRFEGCSSLRSWVGAIAVNSPAGTGPGSAEWYRWPRSIRDERQPRRRRSIRNAFNLLHRARALVRRELESYFAGRPRS
jgi:hypothetical protein